MVWTNSGHYSRLTLCQLPALITCSWVPGFGVCVRYLTLPLLPLAVYYRLTWEASSETSPQALRVPQHRSFWMKTQFPTQRGLKMIISAASSPKLHVGAAQADLVWFNASTLGNPFRKERHEQTHTLSLQFSESATPFTSPSTSPPWPHWWHMQEHVHSARGPSSKQNADRTDRKYVLCSRISGWPVLVFPQSQDFIKSENSYSAA